MGMDPVKQDEVYEVTVQLEGPVGEKALEDYEKELNDFVKKARLIQDAGHSNNKLKARKGRSGVRPKSA